MNGLLLLLLRCRRRRRLRLRRDDVARAGEGVDGRRSRRSRGRRGRGGAVDPVAAVGQDRARVVRVESAGAVAEEAPRSWKGRTESMGLKRAQL